MGNPEVMMRIGSAGITSACPLFGSNRRILSDVQSLTSSPGERAVLVRERARPGDSQQSPSGPVVIEAAQPGRAWPSS
jgi:hypothetical protein